MSQITRVFVYEFRRNLRRRGFLFTTFGIPLIAFVLFFGYRLINAATSQSAGSDAPASTSQQEQGVADSDLLRAIKKAGYVDFSGEFSDPGDQAGLFTRYPSESEADSALDREEIDAYFVIPADYLDTGEVTLVLQHFSLTAVMDLPIRRLLLSGLAQGVDSDVFSRLVSPAAFREVNLQRDTSGGTESNFNTDFPVVYLFAVTFMLGVFMTNGYLMQTVIEEKESRLIEILVSSVRSTHLLAGKILALGLLGMVQIGVWLGAVLLFGRLAISSDIAALLPLGNLQLSAGELLVMLAYFAAGYLFFAAAYGIVGALSSSLQEGPQYAVVFTLPAVIPFYFITVFVTTPDAPLAVALSLIPLTSPLAMIIRVTLTTVPVWQFLLSLALLLATDVVMIWLAGRVFRVQTLLAGQTPRLRDLPRLLRG